MSVDTREDSGEFYPGGNVVTNVPQQSTAAITAAIKDIDNRVTKLEQNGGGGGGGSSVTVDDALTQDGENPVKSKGIWSAIWGAVAAPAASVYEWVTKKLSEYAKTAEVPAAIGGKEIMPSDVVMEAPDGEGGVSQRLQLDVYGITYEDFEFGDGEPTGMGWSDLVLTAKKYDFFECEAYDIPSFNFAEIIVFPYKVNHASTDSYSGSVKNISLIIEMDSSNTARDLILVFDCYAYGYRIEWTEEGQEYTFHPRGGDTSNLEVVAGKRNVFFITEVQPNQFMVARDELELPDAGGDE